MSQSRTVRILLVDDHPLVRDGLRARLEAVAGFHVVGEAGDAQQALEQASRLAPDIALMDVSLRGTNGIEATRSLRERLPQVCVIMLSMHDQPQVVVEAFRAGARGYVLKDSPAREIIAAIDTVLDGRRYYSAGVADALAAATTTEPMLTPREEEILVLIADGLANKDIARRLNLSVRTVETHRLHMKRKLNLEGTAALVRYALERKTNGL